MKDTVGSSTDIIPSAVPTDEGIREWEALPRDEQLRRLRRALTHPDCDVATSASMDDILAKARTQSTSARRG